MSNPDAPECRALAAANQISTQVGQLWLAAHADGIRNGMEVAAQLLDSAATDVRGYYEIDSTVRDCIIVTLEHLRDSLRLVALQSATPEAPRA